MAFVLAATSTGTTGLTSVTSFFVPTDHQFSSSLPPQINFLSGTEYYTTGNQYTSNNSLYIDDASPKINNVLRIYFGGYNSWWNLNTEKQLANYINFSLFPQLSSVNGEGNGAGGSPSIPVIDFRNNLKFRNFTQWGGSGLKALLVNNLPLIQGMDLRQSSITNLPISGATIGDLNANDMALTAIELSAYVNQAQFGYNPFPSNYANFDSCSVAFLTGIKILKFSRYNQFSGSFNYRLNSINLNYPLSSLEFLDLAQNSLTSVEIPELKTLKTLYIGDVGSSYTASFPQTNLSANSIKLGSLSALEQLYMGGIGPISSTNVIQGMRSLSSLRILDISRNNEQNAFTNLDLSIIPGRKLEKLFATNCNYLTSINFTGQPFDSSVTPSEINLEGCTNLKGANFTPASGVLSLDIDNCPALDEKDIVFSPNNILETLYAGSSLRSINTLLLNINLRNLYLGFANTLTAINLDKCTRLNNLQMSYAEIETVGLSSLSAATSIVITDNPYLLNLDFKRNGQLQQLIIASNLALSSVTSLSGLSSLINLDFQANTNLGSMDLRGLSALKFLYMDSNLLLSSVNTDFKFNNLQSLTINNTQALSTIQFTNCPVLSTVSFIGVSFNEVLLNNNFNLQSATISLNNYSQMQGLRIRDNPNLKFFTLNGNIDYPKDLNFTNTPEMESLSLSFTQLTSLDLLTPLVKLKNLNITGDDSLSGVSFANIIFPTSLSAISFANCTNIINTDFIPFNLMGNLRSISFINCNLSAVNSIIQNLPNKNLIESLNFSSNLTLGKDTQTLNGFLLSSFTGLKSLNFNSCRMNYIDWDSVIIGLCAAPTFGQAGNFSFNINATPSTNQRNRGRSRASNTQYVTLTSRMMEKYGAVFTVNPSTASLNNPRNLTQRAKPLINNLTYPTILPYTSAASINFNTNYLNIPVNTFLSVVSGPGILTQTNTVSALSSSGTITVLLSTEDQLFVSGDITSGQFAPVSAYAHINLSKLNVSSTIVFETLGKIYTGFPLSAVAYLPNNPQVSFNYVYALNDVVTQPIMPGIYSVSATVISDLFEGTATSYLSVYDLQDVYNLPASAACSTIYFPQTIDSDKDAVVSFDFAMHGSDLSGSEGFCVHFTDANSYNVTISGGGPGKGLGYCNTTLLSTNDKNSFEFIKYAGKFRGTLGIGFDVTGNYVLSGIDVTGSNVAHPNTITIRDSHLKNYNTLYTTKPLHDASFVYPINLYQNTMLPQYYTAKVRLTNIGRKITVEMKPASAEKFAKYLDYDLTVPLSGVQSIALSYSSGFNKPIFKIKNFNLNCFVNAVTATPYDLFAYHLDGPGILGYSGITLQTPYKYSFFYNPITPTSLPLVMDLYVLINETPVQVASIDYDIAYHGQRFGVINLENDKVYYGNFLSGANILQ